MSRNGFPKQYSQSEHVFAEWRDNNSGAVVYGWNFSYPYPSYGADSIGGNTPGWPTVKQENPYTAWETTVKAVPCSFDDVAWTNNSKGFGSYPMTLFTGISDLIGYMGNWDYPEIAAAVSHMKQKLISRIKDQKVNVAQAAAEFRQTASTVTNVARRLASAILSVKRGNMRQAARDLTGEGARRTGRASNRLVSSGSVANDWLQLQYGWKPLLSDVYGACEELARLTTYNPKVYSVSASAKEESHAVLPPINTPPSSWGPSIHGKKSVKASCRGTVELEMAAEWLATLARTGITNPAALAWELVPYSFVVDWFLPVGNYLSSWDYDAGLRFRRGWYTVKVEVDAQWKAESTVVGTPGVEVSTFHGDGELTGHARSFQREIMGNFPQMGYPSFKDPRSLLHAANAIALLRQAFSKEPGKFNPSLG